MSFGWMCLFTVILGAVCLGGIQRIRQAGDHPAAMEVENSSQRSATPMKSEAERVAVRFQTVIVALLATILGINFLMAWRLTHIIGDPILSTWEVLERISHRDLTAQTCIETEDEIGQMCAALGRTVGNLHQVLTDLADSAVGLERAAGDLADQTAHSSGNCHQQVNLAQQVLESTRLLAAKGSEIARNSYEAAAASRASSQTAASGGETMTGAAQTMAQVAAASTTIGELMGRLDSRAQEIGKVVTTIREISENTNLLALNAAIEAARAGEAGRGFAVVAGEVRRLAEHTHIATEEIASMVESIQQETVRTTAAVQSSRQSIEQGLLRTQQAQQMLTQIVASASQSESLAEGTARAAEEQAAAGQQISSNAAQVAELANASLNAAQTVSNAGQSIRASAQQLSAIVHQFKL